MASLPFVGPMAVAARDRVPAPRLPAVGGVLLARLLVGELRRCPRRDRTRCSRSGRRGRPAARRHGGEKSDRRLAEGSTRRTTAASRAGRRQGRRIRRVAWRRSTGDGRRSRAGAPEAFGRSSRSTPRAQRAGRVRRDRNSRTACERRLAAGGRGRSSTGSRVVSASTRSCDFVARPDRDARWTAAAELRELAAAESDEERVVDEKGVRARPRRVEGQDDDARAIAIASHARQSSRPHDEARREGVLASIRATRSSSSFLTRVSAAARQETLLRGRAWKRASSWSRPRRSRRSSR